MRLSYLWIQRFGKLKEREIFLADGINVIYGPNESGKSTLHSFIRGMLFGIPRYRGRASKTDPYTRFEPWERPADYAGSMRFEAGGKEFRIDRNFYKSDIRESLVCESDGEQLSISHGDLEMILGGISESVYDNTVSIGQLRSETDEGMVRELQKYMSNYEGAGSGEIDVQMAVDRLKRKRKEWEARKQGQEEHNKRQQEQLENKIAYVRQEKEGLEKQLQNIRSERRSQEIRQRGGSPQKREEEINKIGRQYHSEKKKINGSGKRKVFLAGAVLGILLLLIGLLMRTIGFGGPQVYVLTAGILLLVCSLAGMIYGIFGKRNPENSGSREIQDSINRLIGREEELNQQLEEKETLIQNLLETKEELLQLPDGIRTCDTEIKSLDLAIRTMGQISGNMRRRIGRRLQNRMEEILSEITEGKYGRIAIDEDMKITLYEWNRQISLYQLSRGTVEQVYFALRMAVSEILCEEQLPILLDDVFAMYDEERLKQTLRWLDQRGGQVLIFTCHRREAELLAEMGIRAAIIEI